MSASLRAAAQLALPILRDYIRDAGPCDHDVNICVCGVVSAADSLVAALAEPDGWISAETILPETERGGGINDSGWVLARDARGNVNVACLRLYEGLDVEDEYTRWIQRGRDGWDLEGITHWRAIP